MKEDTISGRYLNPILQHPISAQFLNQYLNPIITYPKSAQFKYHFKPPKLKPDTILTFIHPVQIPFQAETQTRYYLNFYPPSSNTILGRNFHLFKFSLIQISFQIKTQTRYHHSLYPPSLNTISGRNSNPIPSYFINPVQYHNT